IETRRTSRLQKLEVGPQPAQTRTFRISIQFLLFFILTRIALLRGIQLAGVALVVPPREAHVTRDHVRARMHMANHALRARNLARELVFDWMTRLVFRNTRISRLRTSEIAGLLVESRVRWIAIVCIDDVTGRTTR